ncbi:hypothetical protein RP20_CCG020194 [Aedes albopictus]|nr:hypothetical protein RP20_CCG020194 [Aedes albopictus]
MGAPYHPSTNGQAERYVQTFKQKLKALRCSKSQLDVELANILMTYRKMIHPSTGQSPSMMMFGRQIKSRLDLMLPKNPGGRPTNPVARSFSDGDRVRVRDFLSGNKWQFGTVVTKVGKLRYSIRLDDGRLWERHVDHMAGVGPNLKPFKESVPRAMAEDNYELIDPVPPATAASRGGGEGCTTVAADDQFDPGATSPRQRATAPVQPVANGEQRPHAVVSDGNGQQRNEGPLRRSTRVVKPPQRLNL